MSWRKNCNQFVLDFVKILYNPVTHHEIPGKSCYKETWQCPMALFFKAKSKCLWEFWVRDTFCRKNSFEKWNICAEEQSKFYLITFFEIEKFDFSSSYCLGIKEGGFIKGNYQITIIYLTNDGQLLCANMKKAPMYAMPCWKTFSLTLIDICRVKMLLFWG